ACVRPYVLHVEPEEQNSRCALMLPSALQARCFLAARRAPGSPEVQDRRRALELAKTQLGAGESRGEALQPGRQYSPLENRERERRRGGGLVGGELAIDRGVRRLGCEPVGKQSYEKHECPD